MEEISEEDFERLKEWKPRGLRQIDVFENANTRINRYDSQKNGWKYNRAYHKVLNARMGSSCLVDIAGKCARAKATILESYLLTY